MCRTPSARHSQSPEGLGIVRRGWMVQPLRAPLSKILLELGLVWSLRPALIPRRVEKVDIRRSIDMVWGERRGGPRGTPEEVPPPSGRRVAPRGVGGDPGQRRRDETTRIQMRMRWL